MNRRSNIIALIFLCFFSYRIPLCIPDMVYLKSGANFEGIVENDGSDTVTLNMGYGKITVEKKDIKDIKLYGPYEQNRLKESWNYKYFSRQEFVPQGLKDIAVDFDNLTALRQGAVESKRERDKFKRELNNAETQLEELGTRLSQVSEELNAANPQDALQRYNLLVDQFNSLVTKTQAVEYNKSRLQKVIAGLDKKISGYVSDFGQFRKKFAQRYGEESRESKKQNRFFFDGIKNELAKIEGDFTKHSTGFEPFGSGIVVEALVNGSLKTNLVVDTGATLVVIPEGFAERLGLDLQDKGRSFEVRLADGRTTKAIPIILQSLKVGDAEVKNVRAAVLKSADNREEFGLLGLSFLEHFVLKIDAKANRLIFEEFNP